MKMKMTLAVVAIFYTTLLSAQKLVISGQVPAETKVVILKAFDGDELAYKQVDIQDVKKGSYTFRLAFDTPNLYQVDFDGKVQARLSVSRAGKIKVDLLDGEVRITGSEESLKMIRFEARNGELQEKHFGQLKKDADAAMASGDKEAMAEIQERSAVAIQAFLQEFRALIIAMGETPAGYFAIQFSDFNKEIDFISQRLEAFQKAIPESPVTRALARQVYRSTVVAMGAEPPAIEAKDSKGKDFSLDQYEGKVLLVDFWAAWCRACRIENPQFVALYKDFQPKGLEIVSISQDEDPDTWQKAIAKDGVGIWRQIQDRDGNISETFSISSLPQNLVLGRDGKIIGKNVTAAQLKELLAHHL